MPPPQASKAEEGVEIVHQQPRKLDATSHEGGEEGGGLEVGIAPKSPDRVNRK
jgi:hypothetical protein